MASVTDTGAVHDTTLSMNPSGSNRRMYVAVVGDTTGDTSVTPSVTFKTTETFTQIFETTNAAGQYMAVFRSDTEPTTGAGNVVVTGSADIILLAAALQDVGATPDSDTDNV